MKRRVLMLALFLVLGAIGNVAVAWGCGALIPVTLAQRRIDDVEAERVWQRAPFASRFPTHSPDNVSGVSGSRLGRDATVIEYVYLTRSVGMNHVMPFLTDSVVVVRIAAGWPCKSLAGETWWIPRVESSERSDLSGLINRQGLVQGPIQPADFRMVPDDARIPVFPVWPGFAINTVFYAAVLWVFVAAPFALRRRRRIKRGLCPRCAYPVGTNAVCTECGAAVTHNMVACSASTADTA